MPKIKTWRKTSQHGVLQPVQKQKKLILMLSSLSLSIILFSTIFTVISSLDVNKYLRAFISGDFVVQNEVLVSITGPRDGDPYKLSEEFANNLSKIDGVETVDKVYHRYVPSPVDDAVRAILEPMAAADPHPYLLSTLDKGDGLQSFIWIRSGLV